MKSKVLRWSLTILVLAAFALFVWWRVDIQEVWSILSSVNLPFFLFASLGIYGLIVACNTLKWKYLLDLYGIHYGFFRLFRYYLVGMMAGFFLSDSIGAFVKAFYIKRDGNSFAVGVVTIVLDKLTELAVFLVAGAIALSLSPALAVNGSMLWAFIMLAILGLLSAPVFVRYWQTILRKANGVLARTLNRSFDRLAIVSQGSEDYLQVVHLKDWLWIFANSTISQFLQYFLVFVTMRALGIQIPMAEAIVITVTSTLMSLIPVSFGGIGTRDAVIIFWFSLMNIPAEYAVALSVLLLVCILAWRAVGAVIFVADPPGSKARPEADVPPLQELIERDETAK